MNIQDRVVMAITLGIEKRLAEAMNIICPAIEATARKKLKKDKISNRDFKHFLRQYFWLMEPFSGEGIDFEKTRFPHIRLKSDGDRLIANPDIADIVYHVHRCALAHGFEIGPNFQLIPSEEVGRHSWYIKTDGTQLNAPEALLWALVAVVLFCDANRDLDTTTPLFLSWGGGPRPVYQFNVDVFWGGEQLVEAFFNKRPRPRLEIKF